jgi:hypothetical protein
MTKGYIPDPGQAATGFLTCLPRHSHVSQTGGETPPKPAAGDGCATALLVPNLLPSTPQKARCAPGENRLLGQTRASSSLANIVGADIHNDDAITFDIKHSAQIALNIHGIDRSSVMRGKTVNLMRAETWIKWVLLENLPRPSRRFLLPWRQVAKTLPKILGRLEAILHFPRRRDGGGASFRTASMSANRLAAASAMPRLKDSGIQESSDSTTNLATSARSLGGNALNCLMTVCAVMPRMNHCCGHLARGKPGVVLEATFRRSLLSAKSAFDFPLTFPAGEGLILTLPNCQT